MFRTFLSLALTLTLTGFTAVRAEDAKDKANKGQQATITKVDAKNHTVTVRMKDKSGKEVEKTFKLTEDIRYLDSTGKVAAVDVFRSGDEVLVVEAEGQLKTLQRNSDAKADKDDNTDFWKAAAEIDAAEVKLGQLAQERGSSPAIKKFGERIMTDHSKMNKELEQLAKSQGKTLASKIDKKHQDLIDQLSTMKGADFDRAFAKDMVMGHEKAIQKFEAAAKNEKDAELKTWAAKWLPTLKMHLEMARAAAKDVESGK